MFHHNNYCLPRSSCRSPKRAREYEKKSDAANKVVMIASR